MRSTSLSPSTAWTAQSGKPQFSYIYGVALLGITAIYTLLNLMSERGIDAYRTASVLGYCLLPMVGLGTLGMGIGMECVNFLSFPWLFPIDVKSTVRRQNQDIHHH